MSGAPEIFWDTCVFCAHFYDQSDQYGDSVKHIRQYLREAREGKWRIITSSVVFAEIAISKVKRGGPGSIEDVVRDIDSACLMIEPNPNILILAGKLRDLPYKKQIAKVDGYPYRMQSCSHQQYTRNRICRILESFTHLIRAAGKVRCQLLDTKIGLKIYSAVSALLRMMSSG